MRCKKCDGTGILASGAICDCGAFFENAESTVVPWVPIEYQGSNFIPDMLPITMRDWGETLLNLQKAILSGEDKLNYLLIAPYASGKTIWAYDTLVKLSRKGYAISDIVDMLDYRRCILSYNVEDIRFLEKVYTVPFLIVRIPTMTIPNLPSLMQSLQYKRVQNNGRTIYLYSGTYTELCNSVDKPNVLKSILGSGTLHSIKVLNAKKGETVCNI